MKKLVLVNLPLLMLLLLFAASAGVVVSKAYAESSTEVDTMITEAFADADTLMTEADPSAADLEGSVDPSAVGAEGGEPAFTVKTVKVFDKKGEIGELGLRFYDITPDIPYMGMNEYSQFIYGQTLSFRENEDGTCVLTNAIGKELVADAAAGRISVDDWYGFFDLPLPLENEAKGWKDTSTSFIRISDVEYLGEAEKVELDFAAYGIRIYSDENDIYLPVSTLSNVMTDIATNHLLYNGESLFALRMDMDGLLPENYYESDYYKGLTQGGARPDDIVKQSYADLCFNFDNFFGFTGRSVLDEALAEDGLDLALESLGEEGLTIKEGAHSADISEYINSMNSLFERFLGDGHTVFTGGMSFLSSFGLSYSDSFNVIKDLVNSPIYMSQILYGYIPLQRRAEWGDDPYREYGKTAILRLDSFMPDEKAWDDYYKNQGDFPGDDLGNVVTGLRRASENPEIENIIFDLTGNSGGSPDVMMSILAMTTGQTQLYGKSKITGQDMIFTFEADTNFDGVYDEKDKEVRYDFNYGVLLSRHAFSCGNLFPIIIQEAGAVIIGESSSGGSCCVQVGTDAEGINYMMSSGRWPLVDENGESVEGGCKVDMPIMPVSNRATDLIASVLNVDSGAPSFKRYYNEAVLDEMMKSWFAKEEEAELAA